jgi:hypothetical protein
MKDTILSVIAIIVAGSALFVALSTSPEDPTAVLKKLPLGAAGGLLAESYIPYVLYNGGYNSEKSIKTTGDLTVGSNGSTNAEMKAATCDLVGPGGADVSVAATSSAMIECAVTGIASGDVVFAQLATTTKATGLNQPAANWWLTSAKASTTAGFVTLWLYNGTGAATVPSAVNIGSSTNIWYVDN